MTIAEGCLAAEDVARLLQGDTGPHLDAARGHLDECVACQDLVALCAPVEEHELQENDTVLGRYRILGELGRGGMGVVYRAHDPKLHRELAVKVLHSADRSAPRRMEREAQALARLSHPNIVTVFDVGTDRERVCMAMELVRGVPLRAWLRGERSRADVLDVLRSAGEGLAAAHESGIIHRDFKPENVLVGDGGRVKIVDFGLAAPDVVREHAPSPSPAALESSILTHRLTRTGAVVGTPAYMAPEQYRGVTADARSDQFAFAVCAWEALHGEHPFFANTVGELRRNMERGPRVGSTQTSRDPARRVLERALSLRPEERFESMTELLAAMRATSHTTKWRSATAIGALLLVVCAAIAVAIEPEARPRQDAQASSPPAAGPTSEPGPTASGPSIQPVREAPTARPSAAPPRSAVHRSKPPPPLPSSTSAPTRGPNGAPLID